MTFFVASVDSDALSVTADVRGLTFARALERLIDLAFADAQQVDLSHPARYTLHPLVRAFARNELARDKTFEAGARTRWLAWYLQLATQVGYCRNDLSRLELLGPESSMIHEVAGWAQRNQCHSEMLALATGCGFYCYVHGLMNRKPDINLLGAEAARALGKPLDELQWLSYHVQRLSRTGNTAEARQYLDRLEALASTHTLPTAIAEAYHHSLATYYLALGQVDKAEQEWRDLLASNAAGGSSWLVTSKWLATCLRQKGERTQARVLLEQALQQAGPGSNQRAAISLQLEMVRICLDEGSLEAAEQLLSAARARVERGHVERHIPDVRMLEGLLLLQKGDLSGAREALAEAVDRFERIGLRRELTEARRTLAEIAGD